MATFWQFTEKTSVKQRCPHSKAKIRLVQHCASISATAELMCSSLLAFALKFSDASKTPPVATVTLSCDRRSLSSSRITPSSLTSLSGMLCFSSPVDWRRGLRPTSYDLYDSVARLRPTTTALTEASTRPRESHVSTGRHMLATSLIFSTARFGVRKKRFFKARP